MMPISQKELAQIENRLILHAIHKAAGDAFFNHWDYGIHRKAVHAWLVVIANALEQGCAVSMDTEGIHIERRRDEEQGHDY